MSNNLDLTQVSESQENADAAINDKGGELDAALTEVLAVDVTSADATVTSANYRRAIKLLVSGATVARAVTLPAVKRAVIISSDADNTAAITITVGATEIVLAAGKASWFYTDGTTDGLEQIGSAGGGGSGSGTGKAADLATFVPDKPNAGVTVLRFNVVRAFTLPSGLTGSLFNAGVAATATAAFDIKQNGTSIGTISYAAAATVPTITFSTAVDFAVDDLIEVIAPATKDATLADISFGFLGSRAADTGFEPADLNVFVQGKPTAGATVLRFNVVREFLLKASLTGSLITAGTASTGTAAFDIKQNGTSIGTLTFTTDDVATTTFADDVFFAVGDLFEAIAPATQDATLADVAINLLGSR